MKYNEREIVRADLGEIGTAEIFGHEQGGTRPVLIINYQGSGNFLIVPLTSSPKQIERLKMGPRYYPLFPNDLNNLTKDSVVLCSQLRTISKDRFVKRIGEVEEDRFNEIKTAIIDIISGE